LIERRLVASTSSRPIDRESAPDVCPDRAADAHPRRWRGARFLAFTRLGAVVGRGRGREHLEVGPMPEDPKR